MTTHVVRSREDQCALRLLCLYPEKAFPHGLVKPGVNWCSRGVHASLPEYSYHHGVWREHHKLVWYAQPQVMLVWA